MGSSDLAYGIADTVVGNREELDRLAAFFPEDAMVGTLRTKLSLEETVQHLSLDEKGSSDEWTRKIQKTVDNTKELMDRAVKTKEVETFQQFLLDPRSVSTKTMTQALGVQGRLRDVAYFMGMIAASIKAKQPESNQIDMFNTSIKDLSDMASVLSEGVESVFAIRTRLTPTGMISAFLTELGESPVEKEGEQTDEEVRLASIRKFLEKRGAGETTRNHKELIKLFDVSIKGRSLDEIKKIEDDHKKEVLKIKTGYRTQFDAVLGGVEPLRALLKDLYIPATELATFRSTKAKTRLAKSQIITPDGKWNTTSGADLPDPRVWIQSGAGKQPDGAIIVVDPFSAPLTTGKPVFEFNFGDKIEQEGEVITLRQHRTGTEDFDTELKKITLETQAAITLLKFFSGDIQGRKKIATYADSIGAVEKLLNQRGALVQSTTNIEGAFSKQYKDMAKSISDVAKRVQEYEGTRSVSGKDRSDLRAILSSAEIIHIRGDTTDWLAAGGGYREIGEWPFTEKPFQTRFLEKMDIEGIEANHPKTIKSAIEALDKAYWEAVRMQEAITVVTMDKVSRMRETVFGIFNDAIVSHGLSLPVPGATGVEETLQMRLQKAGPDVFSQNWQTLRAIGKDGLKDNGTPLLNMDVESEMERTTGKDPDDPNEKADWQVVFKRISDTSQGSDAVKAVPVENLVQALLADPIGPVMNAFVSVFRRLNAADTSIYKLGQMIYSPDGIDTVASRAENLEEWVDDNDLVRGALGLAPFSKLSEKMKGITIDAVEKERGVSVKEAYRLRKLAALEANERALKLQEMVTQIGEVYDDLQNDAISAMQILKLCIDNDAVSIIPEAKLAELAKGETPKIRQIYERVANAVIETLYNTDGSKGPTISNTVNIRFVNKKDERWPKEYNFERAWTTLFGTKETGQMDATGDPFQITYTEDVKLKPTYQMDKLGSLSQIEAFLVDVVKRLTRERRLAIDRAVSLVDVNAVQAVEIIEFKKKALVEESAQDFASLYEAGREDFRLVTLGMASALEKVQNSTLLSETLKGTETAVLAGTLKTLAVEKLGTPDIRTRIESTMSTRLVALENALENGQSVYDSNMTKLLAEVLTHTAALATGIARMEKPLSDALKNFIKNVKSPLETSDVIETLRLSSLVVPAESRLKNSQINDNDTVLVQKDRTISDKNEDIKRNVKDIKRLESECTAQKNQLKELWNAERKGLEAHVKRLDKELQEAKADRTEAVEDLEMAVEEVKEAEVGDVFKDLEAALEAAEATLEEKTALYDSGVRLFDKVLNGVADINARVASGFGRTEVELHLKTVRAFREGETSRADAKAGIERDGVKTLENWTEKMRKYLEVLPEAVEVIYSLLAQENDRRQGVIDGLEAEKTTFESTKTALTEKVGELEETARGFEGAFKELAVPLERVIRVIFKVYKNFNDDSLESKETMVLKSGYDPDGFMKWFRPISGSIVSDLTRLFTFYDDDIHDLKNRITAKEGELSALVTKKEALDTRVEGFEVEKAKAVEDATTELTTEATVLRRGNRVLRIEDKKLREELGDAKAVANQANRFADANETLRGQFAEAQEAIRIFLADNIETNTEMEHLREELKQASLLAIRPPSTTGPAVTASESRLQDEIKEKEDEIDLLKAEMEKLKGLQITLPVIKEILDAMWKLPSPLQDRYTREEIRALEQQAATLVFLGKDSGEIEHALAEMRTANVQADANGFLSNLTKEDGSERSSYVAHLTHIRNALDENIVIPALRDTIYTRALEMFPYDYSAELDNENTNERFISVISGVLALAGITGPLFHHNWKMEIEMKKLEDRIPKKEPGVKKRKISVRGSPPAEFSMRELQLMKRNPTKMSEVIHLISSVKLTDANGSTSARIEEIVPEEEEKDNEPDDGWSLWL